MDVVGSGVQTNAMTLLFASKLEAHSFARISATGISSVSLTTIALLFGVSAHFFVAVSWRLYYHDNFAFIIFVGKQKIPHKNKKSNTCELRTMTCSYASPWRPYIMRARGPNNAGWVLETDATFLCYTSDVTEQGLQQQSVETDATCGTAMLRPFARTLTP